MKELNLDVIKSIEIKLLDDLTNICKENHFNYSLSGGTLLGSIRHKGFIPWDDDIDILMPRKDYNNFINYCVNNKIPFNVLNCRINKEYGLFHTKICDVNTKLIEDTGIRGNYIEGVFVDIFPIDYMGDTLLESRKKFNKKLIKLEVLNAANWDKYSRSKTKGLWVEPIRLFLFLFTRFINPNKLVRKIEDSILKDITIKKYSGCYGSSYRTKEILKSDVYMNYTSGIFENKKYNIMSDYNSYLGCLYGNYMELPPKEKQISHHGFKAYYIDEKRKD